MTVATRSPLREVDTLRERFDKLVGDLMTWPREPAERVGVPLDMQESDGQVVVTASLPGYKPEDINVEVAHGMLTISGESREEHEREEGTWHIQERRFGSVQRTITLPAPVAEDAVTAELKDGVLTVTLPKTDQTPKRRIEITTG